MVDIPDYGRGTTPVEQHPRCPECNAVTIHRRRSVALGEADGPEWFCRKCDADFDEPVRQEVVTDGGLQPVAAYVVGETKSGGARINLHTSAVDHLDVEPGDHVLVYAVDGVLEVVPTGEDVVRLPDGRLARVRGELEAIEPDAVRADGGIDDVNVIPSVDPARSLRPTRSRRRSAATPGADSMDRTTLRLPEQLLAFYGSLSEDGSFPNRSEAMRAALVAYRNAWEEQER